jgi:hypothetical protein
MKVWQICLYQSLLKQSNVGNNIYKHRYIVSTCKASMFHVKTKLAQ